ncbi:hypothetical protein C8T65DRAFT_279229 [Cerioporus squamosus]|nr:hypothetical protein C8T65DRAFT_279229 [Cerioporus squamosus]
MPPTRAACGSLFAAFGKLNRILLLQLLRTATGTVPLGCNPAVLLPEALPSREHSFHAAAHMLSSRGHAAMDSPFEGTHSEPHSYLLVRYSLATCTEPPGTSPRLHFDNKPRIDGDSNQLHSPTGTTSGHNPYLRVVGYRWHIEILRSGRSSLQTRLPDVLRGSAGIHRGRNAVSARRNPAPRWRCCRTVRGG